MFESRSPCRSAARSVLLLAFILTPELSAQETPTERGAASDVVRKMTAMQKTLDVPSLVSRLTSANPVRDAIAARAKELMDTELLKMADDITHHPEIGFKEERSVRILTDYLKAHDFDVTMGGAGLSTAFVAKYRKGTPGPNLGVILEYDALRGTKGDFHGDQHSAQGPTGMAAGIAVAEYLTRSKTPGTVTFYGTPGEEMMPPPAKTVMHEAGIFNEADVIVRSHSSTSTQRAAHGFGSCCLNIDGVKYVFSGAPAHQMTPWEGRDALTAAIHLFNNIDAMRRNMRPETRIQGIITEGGKAPNVVPDRAVADFYIRYPDQVYLTQVREMVDNAARAAALATGTQVKIEPYGTARDGIAVATLDEVAFAYLKKYGGTKVQDEPGKPQGYEETGSVSRAIPGVGFSAHTSNGGFHTYEMEADALGPVGHQGFVVDAQAMASLLYDFATRADYRAMVKQEFASTRALFSDYVGALDKAYPRPVVKAP